MKLRIDQQALAAAARRGHQHLPNTTVMPQLAALRLHAENGQITISGTDLDTTTHSTLDADVYEPGLILIPARMLADITAALPAGPVDLIADGRQLTATVPDTTYTLPLLDDHNYPALPQAPAAGGHVDGDELAAAIAHSLPAVMPQKDAVGSVAGLGGIHLATDGTHATVSASNRFVIVQHTIAWTPEGPDGDGELLVPEPVLKAGARAFTGPTRLHFADRNGIAAISTATAQLVTRTIAEKFPDFRPWAAPADGAATVDFEPADLAKAAQRMALVNDKERPVSLTIGDGHIEISGGHDDRHSTTRIDCAVDGDLDGFRIAFNPNYLAVALKPVDGTARMWLTSPTKWAHIRPANTDDTTYWATCMPLRMPK